MNVKSVAAELLLPAGSVPAPEATDMVATEVIVDADYITKHIGNLADTSDLSKFIL